jgi:maleylacetoacetate isomerase
MLVVGGRRMTQSLAIVEYLDEKHPLPPLLPPGPEDRAWVRSVALAIACDIHPIDNTRVLAYLQNELAIDQAGRDEWYRHWIRLGFAAIDRQLSERDGLYCAGGTPTLADVCLVPQLYNARRYEVPLGDWPTLLRAEENANKLEAFAAAHPDRQEVPE